MARVRHKKLVQALFAWKVGLGGHQGPAVVDGPNMPIAMFRSSMARFLLGWMRS